MQTQQKYIFSRPFISTIFRSLSPFFGNIIPVDINFSQATGFQQVLFLSLSLQYTHCVLNTRQFQITDCTIVSEQRKKCDTSPLTGKKKLLNLLVQNCSNALEYCKHNVQVRMLYKVHNLVSMYKTRLCSYTVILVIVCTLLTSEMYILHFIYKDIIPPLYLEPPFKSNKTWTEKVVFLLNLQITFVIEITSTRSL